MNYIKQAQDYYAEAPLIILGSGASAAYGMSGMVKLAIHLIDNVKTADLSDSEKEKWEEFCKKLEDKTGLEQALHDVAMTEELTNRIINATWDLLNSEDIEIFHEYVLQDKELSLQKLLRHMFGSSLSIVNIITTNYDRLAEYACEKEQIHHYTGFTHGFLRQQVNPTNLKVARKVNIWKVHGSLDWFKSPLGDTLGLPHTINVPTEYEPQIVTPGTQKYRDTHLDPYRTIFQHADQAIADSNAYFCIGYGFNDEHVQPGLLKKCTRNHTPIIVITRTLSEATHQHVISGHISNYLAIERGSHDNESIVYSSEESSPITVSENLWSLNGFMSLVM